MSQIQLSKPLKSSSLLTLYSYYSMFLALTIFSLVVLDDQNHFFRQGNAVYLSGVCAAYIVSALAFASMKHLVADQQKIVSYFFIEIVCLIILMTGTDRLEYSLASLLLMPVVFANLLAKGILGYAVAAWTTLGMLVTQHVLQTHDQAHHMINSGIYGFLCFMLAFLTQWLSHHLNTAIETANHVEKAARRTRKLTRHALRELPSGVLACDHEQQVLFSNQMAERWFNLRSGDTLPEPLQQTPVAENGHTIEFDEHKYSVRKVILPDSEPGDFLLYAVDHSRIAAEAQQMKLASLGRLTASIAHEIRNPLSALRQASQLLAETDYLQAPERQLTEILEQHCMRINRTVEDILQLSRKRQPVMETLKLKPWLSHFADQFQSQNKDKTFHVQVTCPDELLGQIDPDHLQQVLHNLCGNGLRYALAASGDQATLTLTAGQQHTGRVFLDVADNGTGIAPQQQEHLFEPFFTTEHNGTGLGLYLTRELCEANNATIHLIPLTQGTCFRILLTTDAPNQCSTQR